MDYINYIIDVLTNNQSIDGHIYKINENELQEIFTALDKLKEIVKEKENMSNH